MQPHWTTAQDALSAIINAPRFGILSDFDGTLVVFRPFPEYPKLTDRMKQVIRALSDRVALFAMISGRAALELRTVADEQPGVTYIGNHGLEELKGDTLIVLPEAQEWEERVTAFYHDLGEPEIEGVRYQHKRVTMSVTYRYVENPEDVKRRIKEKLDQVNERYGLHMHEGRTIWEVKPPIALDKGTAVRSLIEEHHLESVLFLGDDITDVYAMDALRDLREQGRVKGLIVGVMGETDVPQVTNAADIIANSVAEVEDLFEWIAERLPAPDAAIGE